MKMHVRVVRIDFISDDGHLNFKTERKRIKKVIIK